MKGKGKGTGSKGVLSGGKGGKPKGVRGAGPSRADGKGERNIQNNAQILNLPADLVARLKDISQTHPDRDRRAFFSTELCGITADLAANTELSQGAVGQAFRIRLECKTRVESILSTLSGKSVKNQPGYVACTQLQPHSEPFTALESICLVIYRPKTADILLVPEWTKAAHLFRSRLDDFVVDAGYVLQDRFGVSRKTLRRLCAEEVMQGIRLQDFSDEEVHILAGLTSPENYEAWTGRALFSARHQVDFQRLARLEVVQNLIQGFKDEASRRGLGETCPSPNLWLPSDSHAAQRIAGRDFERRVDVESTIRNCLFKWLLARLCALRWLIVQKVWLPPASTATGRRSCCRCVYRSP
ncbi:unnamed protein product [Symbiodinium necroappetens]|uniref:Uncharacterized protein n=1 Tax=Symbiodinium necroappetens TaxID=1628268 RepID=A0A812P5T5_9DINO|nr:unnamed protein product [Symbiodinium necroappetens]